MNDILIYEKDRKVLMFLKYGVENYFIYPVHEEDFEHKIKSVLERRRTIENLKKEASGWHPILSSKLKIWKISSHSPTTRSTQQRHPGEIR